MATCANELFKPKPRRALAKKTATTRFIAQRRLLMKIAHDAAARATADAAVTVGAASTLRISLEGGVNSTLNVESAWISNQARMAIDADLRISHCNSMLYFADRHSRMARSF